MHSSRVDALHEQADLATIPSHLFPLLNQIKLSDLQHFLHHQIDNMDARKVNAVYHHSLSIKDIFPTDVMQHILSFGHSNRNRAVCKQWNCLNIQNERNMLRAMYQTLITQDPGIMKKHTYWVLHPKRPKLHPIEIALGYKGPLRSIRCVALACQPGDRVLVHPGYYSDDSDYQYAFHINLHFIGVGSNSDEQCSIALSREVSFGLTTFTNLHIIGDNGIHIMGADSKVMFRQCNIDLATLPLMVGNDARIGVRGCTLRKGDRSDARDESIRCAIGICPSAKRVCIDSNKFINFGRCIEISSAYDTDKLARIIIVDNVFVNSSCKPVVERTDGYEVPEPLMVGSERLTLRGNRCQPQTSFFNQVINMLHHVVEYHYEYSTDSSDGSGEWMRLSPNPWTVLY